MATEQLLTVREAAARIRANPESVRRWLRQGRLHGVKPAGDRLGYRIPESEVERFVRDGPPTVVASEGAI